MMDNGESYLKVVDDDNSKEQCEHKREEPNSLSLLLLCCCEFDENNNEIDKLHRRADSKIFHSQAILEKNNPWPFIHSVKMDPFRGQGGIQMLLTAEQEAQQIVSTARNLRTQRLKQAKDEAEKEATLYRSNMENEYQRQISESTGSSGSNEKRLEEETEAKIQTLKESTSKVSSEVTDMLINYITTVKT
ncbi:hypothetical protein L6164_003556 [Bauhinia variegata]|uniref:Uncharacterized protein n=1 Tax=Bauhinia variegata TaxID=167791 RepID=A0ACB9Q1N6_BAUVA|nr:hypothetical protein L6164_003556 [Bauhinia variegata]